MNIYYKRRTFILIVILSAILTVNAQEIEIRRHIIGVQGPISLNSNLFAGASVDYLFAVRYGYLCTKNITFGPEFSGLIAGHLFDDNDYKSYRLRFGGFARFSFFPDKRIGPFVELSPYFTYSRLIPGSDPIYGTDSGWDVTKISGHIGPGITVKSKNSKISVDIMYKFLYNEMIYGKKHITSCRFNFHF